MQPIGPVFAFGQPRNKGGPALEEFLWEPIAEKNQARDCKFILQYYLEYASKHTE
jgi:hypothetical protein